MRRLLPGVIAIGLLTLPVLVTPFRGADVEHYVLDIEKREPAGLPSPSAGAFLDTGWWTQVDDALADRFGLRDVLIPLKARLGYEVLGQERFGDVLVGRDEWLFFAHSLDLDPTPEEALAHTQLAWQRVEAFLRRSARHRARVAVLVAPDKVSLYPDKLKGRSRALYDRYREPRQLLQESFAGARVPGAIDMWSIFREEMRRSDTLVYERVGTHHTPEAAMLMGKAIVDFARPGLWDPGAVVLSKLREQPGGLSKKAALIQLTESSRLAEVERGGVEVVAAWLDRKPATAADLRARSRWRETAKVRSRSQTQPLYEGETLVLHDSFIGSYLRQPLEQYLANVSFVHWNEVGACTLERALDEYDLIVVEVVERRASQIFRKLFGPCPPGIASSTPPIDHRLDPQPAPRLRRLPGGTLELAMPGGALLREAEAGRRRGRRGVVGRMTSDGERWRVAGWAGDVRQASRPRDLLAFRGDTLELLPGEVAWVTRPGLAAGKGLEALAEVEAGFELEIAPGVALEGAGVVVVAVYEDTVDVLPYGTRFPEAFRVPEASALRR